MNALSNAPAIDGRPKYPRGVCGWLWADLSICSIEAVLALLALLGMTFSDAGADTPISLALPETGVLAGIAAFGILVDVALLRYKPKGAAFARIALLFVGLGMVMGLYELGLKLTDPDPDACPPETVILGGFLGLFFRVAFNAVWFDRVRRARRHLHSLPMV